VAPSIAACGCGDENRISKKEGDKMTLLYLEYLPALPELHGKTIFTKRTHFRKDSTNLQSTISNLQFTKRTQFGRRHRFTPTPNSELFTKRTHFQIQDDSNLQFTKRTHFPLRNFKFIGRNGWALIIFSLYTLFDYVDNT
jgi:hypothetical protein